MENDGIPSPDAAGEEDYLGLPDPSADAANGTKLSFL